MAYEKQKVYKIYQLKPHAFLFEATSRKNVYEIAKTLLRADNRDTKHIPAKYEVIDTVIDKVLFRF